MRIPPGVAIAAGAVVAGGGALYAANKLTGGELGNLTHDLHEAWYAVKHANDPWLAPDAMHTYDDALKWQKTEYGPAQQLDNGGDAFRHTFASELLTEDALKHGLSVADARKLVIGAGDAHELDDPDNAHGALSSDMDRANNRVGVTLIGDGKNADGSWLTEQQLAQRAIDAIDAGKVVRLNAADTQLVPTTSVDAPSSK